MQFNHKNLKWIFFSFLIFLSGIINAQDKTITDYLRFSSPWDLHPLVRQGQELINVISFPYLRIKLHSAPVFADFNYPIKEGAFRLGGWDYDTDPAVIRIFSDHLPHAELCDSDKFKVGYHRYLTFQPLPCAINIGRGEMAHSFYAKPLRQPGQ